MVSVIYGGRVWIRCRSGLYSGQCLGLNGRCLKGAVMDGGVAIVDGNCVSEEGQLLKSEAMNVGVAIADENGVAEEGRIGK